MNEMIKTPEFLFESSWEVCNKVGGIYTVLSTKAHTLQQIFNDNIHRSGCVGKHNRSRFYGRRIFV